MYKTLAEIPVTPNKIESLLAQETSLGLMAAIDDAAIDRQPEYRFQLLQEDEPSQIFTIPASAMQLLIQMLVEMGQGNAVMLTPVEKEVSTQQAADMLNVSRPYLVQLLEAGEIPFRQIGSHRRVKLEDLLIYKQHIYDKRYEVLNELTAYDQTLGLQ